VKVRVFDTEANNLYPAVTVCHCGVFTSLDGKEVDKFPPERQQDMLRFMDTCDVLIGHNVIGYDFPMLKKVCGYVFKGKVVDTLLMSRALNPKRFLPPHAKDRRAGPHSIYAWGVRVGVDKPEHEDWENYSPEMLHRCTEDVEINRLTYHALMKEAAESGGKWRDAFLLTFKLFQNLQEQEEYGWYVDKQKMLDNIVELEQLMQEIDDEVIPQLPNILEILEVKKDGQVNWVRKPFLKSGKPSESSSKHFGLDGCACIGGPYSRIGFRPVDLNSRNEVVSYLLKEGWEPLEWNYNDDGERTSPKLSKDDPFEGVEGEVGKLVSKRVQCRHRKSLVEGLLELVRDDGRISSSIAGMAVTGRMQHRGIVNIPGEKSFFGHEIRQIFSCPPGKVIVGCDSDACQIRMLAGRMNDPAYTETVINGKKEDGTDMHTVNMNATDGLVTNRDDAKTFFYGFLFGAGDGKVGKIIKGTAAQGKMLKTKFIDGLPALKALLEKLTAEWRATAKKRMNKKFDRIEYYDGTIIGLDGRPIKIPSEHQLLVYMLQSDEAIMMAAAYCKVNSDLSKRYIKGKQFGFLTWMHDEYQIECDEDIADDVGKIAAAAIEWAGKYYKIPCPHKGDYKIGRNWAETH
jgi:hypothetical protein